MTAITQFLSGSSPFVYCFIFFGKLFEVSLASLRFQLIVKGQRVPGAEETKIFIDRYADGTYNTQ